MKKSPFINSVSRAMSALLAFAVFSMLNGHSSVLAQEVTPKQLLEAQLAAAGVPVDGSGATAATPAQFKAAVLAAIEANPDRADQILIAALKMIRDKFVASYLDNNGRYNRDALIDLFKSAVQKYGPQNRPSDEARERLEEMLRAANELFPELIGEFREAIDTFLTEDLRGALDDFISKLVAGGAAGGGVTGYFSFSNPGNVGGGSTQSKAEDIEKPKSASQTSGGGGGGTADTGTTPATPVVP